MDIRSLMSTDVAACGPLDTAQAAAKILWEKDLGALPVLDGGDHVVGMVTDRDLCMAAYTRGLRLDDITVESVMSRHVHTCRVDDPLETAETTMERHAVRRLPVVDLGDRIVGIITLADLARHARIEGHADRDALSARAVTRVLAVVTAPPIRRSPPRPNGAREAATRQRGDP